MYHQVVITSAENKSFFLQQRYFEERESTVHLLAVISHSQQALSHKDTIQGPTGECMQELTQMLVVFTDYFCEVYSSKVDPTEEAQLQFLNCCPLPLLTAEGGKLHNAP